MMNFQMELCIHTQVGQTRAAQEILILAFCTYECLTL